VKALLVRIATLRGGLVLLGAAVAIGVATNTLLIEHHDKFVEYQYEYWETYPLGTAAFAVGWIATLVVALAGVASLIAAAVRDPRDPVADAVERAAPASVAVARPGTWRAAVIAVVLLAAAVGALAIGHFIQFDDTSGFGDEQWTLGWGMLAVPLVAASIFVAARGARARLVLAIAIIVLDVGVVSLAIVDDGFRFVWKGDEGELFMLEVVLAVIAVLLLAAGAITRRIGDADDEGGDARPSSLGNDLLASVPRRVVAGLLALGYAVAAAFWIVDVDLWMASMLGIGLACGWAATRARDMRLQVVLWLLAAAFVFYGSIDGLYLVWFHALIAFGVLVAWTQAGRVRSAAARVVWAIVALGGGMLWAGLLFMWWAFSQVSE
jgi:hypothetical protein